MPSLRDLRLSHPFTCVYAAGTKFGTVQTSTGVYELSLSDLSISIFSSEIPDLVEDLNNKEVAASFSPFVFLSTAQSSAKIDEGFHG